MNILGLYPNYNMDKIIGLFDAAKYYKEFLICLTETHFTTSISNNELNIQDWYIIIANRTKRMCGGSAVLYKKT